MAGSAVSPQGPQPSPARKERGGRGEDIAPSRGERGERGDTSSGSRGERGVLNSSTTPQRRPLPTPNERELDEPSKLPKELELLSRSVWIGVATAVVLLVVIVLYRWQAQ